MLKAAYKRQFIPDPTHGGSKSVGLKSKVFRNITKRMYSGRVARHPSVRKYKQFIEQMYLESLQAQLGVTRGRATQQLGFGKIYGERLTKRGARRFAGYASGQLRDGLRVRSNMTIEFNEQLAKLFIDYTVEMSKMDRYGKYIAGGRKAGYIPVWKLVDWLEQKQALGALVIYKRKKQKAQLFDSSLGDQDKQKAADDADRAKELRKIAFAISRKANKRAKPPVLKDWYDYSRNKNLRDVFHAKIGKGGQKYRDNIRKEIFKRYK